MTRKYSVGLEFVREKFVSKMMFLLYSLELEPLRELKKLKCLEISSTKISHHLRSLMPFAQKLHLGLYADVHGTTDHLVHLNI